MDPDVVCKRFASGGRRLRRAIHAIQGLASIEHAAFEQTVDVVNTVVMERVLYHVIDGVPLKPFRPARSVVRGLLKPALRQFRIHSSLIAPWSYSRFCESITGRKRRLYENAVVKLLKGWDWGNVRIWARPRSFVKHEKIPNKFKKMVPRLIQPRTPEYNVLVGCYIKACEHYIYHTITEMSGDRFPVVGKGVDVVQLAANMLGKWQQFQKPVAIGLDQARFDQHISKEVLLWEFDWYNSLFHSDELRRLLRYQCSTDGSIMCSDGIVKYHTDGGRCSGDMNTGLGNTIIQSSIIYSYIATRTDWSRAPRYIVNGDDSVVFCEESDLDKFDGLDDFCRSLGFVLTREAPVTIFEKVSFCQMQPVFNGKEYIMCRVFPRSVDKDTHTTFAMTNKNYLDYLATVGECGLALTSGMPCLQSFYSALYQWGTPDRFIDLQVMMYFRGKLEAKKTPVSDDARVSFWRAFDVLPEHQIAIEEVYDHMKPPVWRPDVYTSYIPDCNIGVGHGVH